MLAGSDWTAEDAASGEAALPLVESRDFDLILADVVMPGMDGLTLLRLVGETRPDAKMVMMTAWNTPSHIVGSLQGHAVSYLSKPFTKVALLETLNTAVDAVAAADDIEVVSDRPHWIAVRVRCKLETADRLVQFFRELPPGLDAADREKVSVAFRELLMNAIEHGGRLDPRKKVDLSYIRTARCVMYYIRDPGEGFSFDQLPHAAISNRPDAPFEHVELREKLGIRPGGFGLLMTKDFADEVLYSSRGNEVLLIKYL